MSASSSLTSRGDVTTASPMEQVLRSTMNAWGGISRRWIRCLGGLAVAALWLLVPAAAGAVTYSTPGSYTLVVPSSVSEVTISATGGGGGDEPYSGSGCGKGGLEQATFAVTPGQTLSITVAGKGGKGSSTTAAGGEGGEGGGGVGGAGEGEGDVLGGGGGGGASSVSVDGSPLLVAAGGGGGGGWHYGGCGGSDGSAGQVASDSGGQGGAPGTPTAGGAGGQGGSGSRFASGSGASGTSGGNAQGGAGGGGTSSTFSGGGGGGGGYYGGGGGGGGPCECSFDDYSSGGGGGGGSDFVASTGSNVSIDQGHNTGDGQVVITYPTASVSVAVDPDTVNVCDSSTCPASVTATATVEDSNGQPLAGQDVSLSSSDPDVTIGAVTDHGDGTYTTSLEPSEKPGDVTITATDNSTNPPVSGTAVLHQVCQPPGAAADAFAGLSVAAASASGPPLDCTTTSLKCLSTGSASVAEEYLCLALVTDVSPSPTVPTGNAIVTLDYAGSQQVGPNSSTHVCPLTGRPPSSAACFFFPRAPIAGQSLVLNALYPGDATHDLSQSGPYNLLNSLLVYHTTAYDRAQLKKAANAEKRLMDKGTYGVAGLALIGLAVSAPVSAPVAGAAGLTWAYGKVDAGNKEEVADSDDPPDLHYATVARPRSVTLPTLPALPGTVAGPIRALLTNGLRATAIDQALSTSVNRASTATLEGDQGALQQQRKAIARYFGQLASLTLQAIKLEKRLAGALRRAHIDTAKITPKEAHAAHRARYAHSQPPRFVLQLLMAGGESRRLAIATWQAISRSIAPGTFKLSSLLTSHELITSELRAAAVFRADAKHG